MPSTDEDKDEDDEADPQDDLPHTQLGRRRLLAVVMDDWLQGHPGIGRNDICQTLNPGQCGLIEVALLCKWPRLIENRPDFGVIQDAFEAVADFHPQAVRVHHDQENNTAVLPGFAQFPLLFQLCGEILNTLTIVKLLDSDHGDFGVGLLVHREAQIFYLTCALRGKNLREVIDVVSRNRKVRDFFCRAKASRNQQQQQQ